MAINPVTWLPPMLPLSCACAHTGGVRRTHTRKLGAHTNVSSNNVFAYTKNTSFQIQVSAGKMLHITNFMRTQTLKN